MIETEIQALRAVMRALIDDLSIDARDRLRERAVKQWGAHVGSKSPGVEAIDRIVQADPA